MVAPLLIFAFDQGNEQHYDFDASITVDRYDLMFHDSDDVKPASSQTDQLAEDLNQRLFARNFAGLADFGARSADTTARKNLRIIKRALAEFDCASSAFEVDDLLAVDEASSGTALEDQKLVKVTDPTLAIARCVKREANAVTRVTVEIGPGVVPGISGVAGLSLFQINGLGSNTETLSDDKTLDEADAPLQNLDPGGAGRDVMLPAESLRLPFVIVNTADAAEVLTIKNDGGTALLTPTQKEVAVVWSDGTTYHGFVASET